MVKRKSPSNDVTVDETPYARFVKMSWEKTDKKGDYNAFAKTCQVKWEEMTENEKVPYSDVLTSVGKRKKEVKETTGRSQTRKKSAKDPNTKKRPPGPYILFCNEMRESVRKSNPSLPITQISKVLGQQWKALSDDERQKYQTIANAEKEKYLKEIEEEKQKNGKD